jgi:hypothetical protein
MAVFAAFPFPRESLEFGVMEVLRGAASLRFPFRPLPRHRAARPKPSTLQYRAIEPLCQPLCEAVFEPMYGPVVPGPDVALPSQDRTDEGQPGTDLGLATFGVRGAYTASLRARCMQAQAMHATDDLGPHARVTFTTLWLTDQLQMTSGCTGASLRRR